MEQLKNNGDLTIAEFCILREYCKGKTEGQVMFMLSYFVSASQERGYFLFKLFASGTKRGNIVV